MAPSNLLSTLLFLSTIISFPAATSPQECPYPCYPPPIGPGDNTPTTPTTPTITTPPASTTPPAATFSPPALSSNPPAGIFPYNPPTQTSYGGAQPPPEPILSWFPYYYRKPPHQDLSSSTSAGGGLRILFFIFPFLVFFSFALN